MGGIPRFREKTLLNECSTYWTRELSSENVTSSVVDKGNATVCGEWEDSKEYDTDEEFELCTCMSMTDDGYCQDWTCSQVMGDTYGTCGRSCYQLLESNTRQCTCEVSIKSAEYCAVWRCIENDFKSEVTFQEYKCVRASSGGHYCEAWTGVIGEKDSSSRVKVVACECEDEKEWAGEGVCSDWRCKQRMLKKCLGMCDMRMALGLGGTLGVLGIFFMNNAVRGRVAVSMGLSLMWMGASAGMVLLWGGIDGVIYAGGLWGVALAMAILSWCFKRKT